MFGMASLMLLQGLPKADRDFHNIEGFDYGQNKLNRVVRRTITNSKDAAFNAVAAELHIDFS